MMKQITMQETKTCLSLNTKDMVLGNCEYGKAVFANRNFLKGEEIIEFKGELLRKKDLPKILKPEDDRHIQIGKNKYLGASGNFDDFFNHSCNPNTGIRFIGNQVILFAIRDIKKSEEITFDYSTTMDEDDWEMDCLCKSKNCRKKIGDFKYLPKEVQDKYIKLGIVPKFILENLNKN